MRNLREPSFEGLHRVLLLEHKVQVGEGEAAAVLAGHWGRQLEARFGGRGHGLQVTARAKLATWAPDTRWWHRYGLLGRIMMSQKTTVCLYVCAAKLEIEIEVPEQARGQAAGGQPVVS